MWPFNRNKHKHEWEIIKVLQAVEKWAGLGGKPITQIYWKCKSCRKTQITKKYGWWELEDLI